MAGDDNMAIARFRGNLVPAPKNNAIPTPHKELGNHVQWA